MGWICNTIDTYMHRTTILLPSELRRAGQKAAERHGITFSELVRRQLTAAVRRASSGERQRDSLFQPRGLMNGGNPGDLSARHDDYLYGERSAARKR
jgi:hypothetical protein